MEPFVFHNPTRVVFGVGRIRQLGDEVARIGRRALLVTGRGHVRRTGVLERALRSLQAASVEVVHFEGVEPNPRMTTCIEAARRAQEERAEVVVGLGGGSVIDASKVIAAIPFYEGDPWDMMHDASRPQRPPTRALPVVSVPTLAATGSEMNAGAVITRLERREKTYVIASCLYPRTAVIDPALTLSVPRDQTAYGAVDTITHVTESYFNGADQAPLQDRMAEAVIRTVIENAPRAQEHPDDLAARSNLQWASVVALNGWVQAGADGSYPVHAIEHVLSGHYDVAHGAGLAVVGLAWMRVAHRSRLPKYVQFAERIFGIEARSAEDERAALAGIDAYERFLERIGAPRRLGDLEIPADAIPRLAEDAIRIYQERDQRLGGIPPLDRKGVEDLLGVAARR